MLVECKNCGAPLELRNTDRFVRCSYCDKVNRVRTMRTMAPETPAGWQPPPTWQPPPQFPHRAFQPLTHHPVRSPLANHAVYLIFGFVLLSSLAGFVPFAIGLLTRSSPSSSPPARAAVTVDLARIPRAAPVLFAGSVPHFAQGADCPSAIPDEPQLFLRTSRPTPFAIWGEGSADTVLVLQTSRGESLCDDDSSEGANPLLTGSLPPGTHRVWLGIAEGSGSPRVTVRMRGAGARLTPFAAPSLRALSDGTGLTARSLRGEVRAAVDVGDADETCDGFVPAEPHLTLESARPQRAAFVLSRHSDAMLVMVRAPNGRVRCESYAPGVPSGRIFELPAGRSAAWVGVRDLRAQGRFQLDLAARE